MDTRPWPRPRRRGYLSPPPSHSSTSVSLPHSSRLSSPLARSRAALLNPHRRYGRRVHPLKFGQVEIPLLLLPPPALPPFLEDPPPLLRPSLDSPQPPPHPRLKLSSASVETSVNSVHYGDHGWDQSMRRSTLSSSVGGAWPKVPCSVGRPCRGRLGSGQAWARGRRRRHHRQLAVGPSTPPVNPSGR